MPSVEKVESSDIRVVVLECDPYALVGMSLPLLRDPTIQLVGEAHSLRQLEVALGRLAKGKGPDVLVVGIDSPVDPELAFRGIEKVRARFPALKVLCLSLLPDLDQRHQLLERIMRSRPDGLLLKPECGEGLGLAVEKCAQGWFVVTRTTEEWVVAWLAGRQSFTVEQRGWPEEVDEEMIRVARLRFLRGLEVAEIVDETGLAKNQVDYKLKKIKSIMGIRGSRHLMTRAFWWVSRTLFFDESAFRGMDVRVTGGDRKAKGRSSTKRK